MHYIGYTIVAVPYAYLELTTGDKPHINRSSQSGLRVTLPKQQRLMSLAYPMRLQLFNLLPNTLLHR